MNPTTALRFVRRGGTLSGPLMTIVRLVRLTVIAGVLAATGLFAGPFGALVSLAAGSIALLFVPRLRENEPKASLAEFLPGGWCTGSFAMFVIALLPFTALAAVTAALVVLSPLFGTAVYLIESVTSGKDSLL